MKIEFSEIDWFWLYADYNKQESLNKIFNKYLISAENLDQLIEKRRNISDAKFANILNDMMCTYLLNTDDIVKIVSLMNNKKYIDCTPMYTTMYHDTLQYKYCVDYNIVYTEKAEFDPSHYYTKEEIQNLVNQKEIVLLKKVDRKIWKQQDSLYRVEEYSCFETLGLKFENYFLNNWFYNLSDYFSSSDNGKEYNKALLKYIKLQVKKYMLEKEMVKSLENFNCNLKDLDETLKKHKTNQSEICASAFEQEGYNEKLTQLVLKYNLKSK